jgi:TonB-linked SusC/RagA family outer membrane protein
MKKMTMLLAWSIMFISLPFCVFSQTRTITGTVTDERGEPLSLVSVLQKGTTNGTTTNEQGGFSLGVTGNNVVLVFSYSGMQSQELNVTTSSTYNVVLRSGGQLSEVVVTALGIRREKRALGYSAQEVSGDALIQTRQTNIVNALRGQVAGVQINSGGGAPGQGSRIVIRGVKSLGPGKNNQPLFVIDGIVMDNSTITGGDAQASIRGMSNRAADINPDDVESISILRGGAATALYGQAGSNGVVVITTKSAKAGKLRVNFTSTYGIEQVNKFPDVQSTYSQGYLGVYDPNTIFTNWGPTVDAARAIDPTHPDRLFHNYARGYQNGNQVRNSISLSGGTDNALITSSFSHFKQNGVLPNSDYENISVRLSTQLRAGTKFRFSPTINYIKSGGYRVNAERYNEQLSYWSPRWDVTDYIKEDGTMKGYRDNPIYGTSVNRFKDDVNRIIGNVSATFSPVSWFDLDYRGGVDFYTDFRRHAAPGPRGLAGERNFSDNGLGFVREFRINNRILTSNLIGTFKKDWGSSFNTTLRLGNDVRAQRFDRVTATGSELDIPTLLTLNNSKVRATDQYMEDYRIVSGFGDLSLSFNNYLFLNVTGRNDWSSSLSPGFNSFFYPSASLSYVFTDHLGKPGWLTFGKLRGSIAEVGKDTDPYETNAYYNSSILTSSSQVTWTRGDRRGEFSLRPEKTVTLELGAELRGLNNRIGLDFSWYRLNSRDQIIPVFVSPTSGYGSVITNAGEVENRGIELVLNGSPIKSRDFSWDATLNFSRNRNNVVSIKEGLTEIVVGEWFGYVGATATMKYIPGYPVGNIYGTSYQRFYGTKEDDRMTIDRSLPIVIQGTGANAGFPARDLTQRILGNSQPDWIGGLTNTFGYKNFTLSFLFETQQGHERYNQLGNYQSAFGTAPYTENRNTTRVFEGVLANGTPNTQSVWLGQGVGPDGRNYADGFYRNVHRGITENFVEDASWVRLRNLSLSYRIPNSVTRTNVFRDASITFTGNNLFLWTKFSGFDPDASSFHSGSNVDAFTGFAYPSIRSFLVSLNVNF